MRHAISKPDRNRSGLRVQDLAWFLDTNPRRIEGWVEQGFLKPAHPGRGPGRPNWFSLENLATGYVLTELQRIHGDKSPVLGRLLSSEPASEYAQQLAKWFRATRLGEHDTGTAASLTTLALVQHRDGSVEGRLEKGSARDVLDYIKRFLGDCVGITLLSPGEGFRAVQERLVEHG